MRGRYGVLDFVIEQYTNDYTQTEYKVMITESIHLTMLCVKSSDVTHRSRKCAWLYGCPLAKNQLEQTARGLYPPQPEYAFNDQR